MANYETTIFYTFYRIYDDKHSHFFTTKSILSKALCNLKKSKDKSIIEMIINDNYSIELLREYKFSEKPTNDFLNSELDLWKRHYKSINAVKLHNFIFNKSHIEQERLKYGLVQQIDIYEHIKNAFLDTITKSNYFFSFFDCIGIKYLYEIKSLRYSINKYPTAIMNTSKLQYPHIIFIFEYTETQLRRSLYYHIYDNKREYNKRYIDVKCNDKLTIPHEIIDIPINELILIDKNNKITIDNLNDEEGIKQLKEIRFLDDEKGKEQKFLMQMRL